MARDGLDGMNEVTAEQLETISEAFYDSQTGRPGTFRESGYRYLWRAMAQRALGAAGITVRQPT